MAADRSQQLDLLDQLADDFAARFRRGERPALTEYTVKHPELADEIRELFPAMVKIEQVDEDRRGPLGGDVRAAAVPLEQIGDYRVLREIGHGGMGVVYEAEQQSLGRHVALKVLPFQISKDAKALERFRREARAAARLHHSNIVPVFEVGQQDDVCYYAMQFIQGQGLDQVLLELERMRAGGHSSGGNGPTSVGAPSDAQSAVSFAHAMVSGRFEMAAAPGAAPSDVPRRQDRADKPARGPLVTEPCTLRMATDPGASSSSVTLPGQAEFSSSSESNPQHYYRSVARVGIQVAEALAYAHDKGVIHRDIKPSNLLLDTAGTVWVTDFGLAKSEGDALTQTGDIVGTLRYMAPERFRGWSDPRSDVYSLGMSLYELLVLRPAFDCPDRLKLIQQVTHDNPPRPRTLEGRIPSDLETIVLKAIDKEPGQRYQTPHELATDLNCFLDCRPIQARRAGWSERFWRLCRRNPIVAGLIGSVAALLVTIALGSCFVAARALKAKKDLHDQFETTLAERGRAERAEREALNSNLNSYLASLSAARAGRFSRQIGQRFESLKALEEAAKIARELGMPEQRFLELCNQAIACMALPDLRVAKEWDGWPIGSFSVDFDHSFTHYARTDRQGAVSIRRVADDAEIVHLPGIGVTTDACPRFSRDGRFLAVGHLGGRIRMWKVDGAEPVLLVDDPSGSNNWDFSPDSRLFAFGGLQGPISIVDLSSGKLIRQLQVGSSLYGLVFHPTEPRFAVLVSKTAIRICDIESGHVLSELLQAEGVDAMAWHPDGKTLAVVGCDCKIHLWNVVNGKPSWVLEGHKNAGIKLTFNNTGDLLASTDWSGTLRLWDPGTGQQVFQTQSSMFPHFSSDDRLLAAKIDGEKLKLLEVAAAREYRTLVRDRAEGSGVYHDIDASPDGRLLAVGMADGFGLWDLERDNELAFVQSGVTHHVLFDPSGALLTNGVSGLQRWPIQRDSTSPTLLRLGPPEMLPVPASSNCIARSRNGQVIASAQGNGALVLHLDRPDQAVSLTPHGDVRYVAVSPDGQYAATGSHNGTGVKIWNADTGRLVKVLLPEQPGSRVGFSADGKWLATNVGGCRLWKVDSWEQGPSIGGGGAFAFSPDSTLLAVEAGYGAVRLLDPDTGREYARLEDPNQDIVDWICFTPDGTHLATSANHNTKSIHVWDLRTIRRQLADINLDWEPPLYPPRDEPPVGNALRSVPRGGDGGAPQHGSPLTVTVDLGEMAGVKQADAQDQQARAYAGLHQWDKAIAEHASTLELWPNHARSHNNLAWLLVSCPDANFRDATAAVEHATRAVELEPNEAAVWNTLGAAQYRTGNRRAAIESLAKSEQLSPGKYFGHNAFFLAMAHWQLDEKEEARKWFDQAVEWMEKNKPQDEELKRFRDEAAELLGP